MSITIVNVEELKSALTGAWQKDLNTSKDPANGKWYTKGANGDNVGLYGGLTDSSPTGLTLDQSKLVYTPKQLNIMSDNVDNRNGLTPTANVTLSDAYTNTTTVTHTITNSLQVGLSQQINASVSILVATIGGTETFSVSYTFAYSSATSTTTSDTITFSETVPVNVPEGKVYQVVLTGTSKQIGVPFTANISVSGETETWFESTVNGHYNWATPAGDAFSWINEYQTAGSDSPNYMADPSNSTNGIVVVSGVLTYSTVGDFTAVINDITPASGSDALRTGSAAKVVKTIKFG